MEKCPVKAINLNEEAKVVELNIGAIIIATGIKEYNASNLKNYGFGSV